MPTDIEELVDTVYACRELEAVADALRKKAHSIGQKAINASCMAAIASGDVGKVKTDYCTGTPDLRMSASIPSYKTHPEEHLAVTRYLGIPDDHVKSGVTRIHWPAFTELITELTANGDPMPPGIDVTKTYPVYKMTVRKKKSLLED